MARDMARNLSTPEKRQRFRDEFGKLVRTHAARLCKEPKNAELLAEDVFLRVELDYRDRLLPSYCEPFLAGKVCLAYALTGGNAEVIEEEISRLREKAAQADENGE